MHGDDFHNIGVFPVNIGSVDCAWCLARSTQGRKTCTLAGNKHGKHDATNVLRVPGMVIDNPIVIILRWVNLFMALRHATESQAKICLHMPGETL